MSVQPYSAQIAPYRPVLDDAQIAALTAPPQPVALPAQDAFRLEPTYHPQLAALSGRDTPAQATQGPSFESQVEGQAPKPIDLQLARIADAAYHPERTTVDGWTRLNDTQLRAAGIDPASLENSETGLRAGIYADDQGRYVLAFAGSNDVNDWINNVRQGLGWDSEQYDQAVQLARLAETAFGDDLVITGHSLGGGLATAAALATDTAAVTFNSAGVHDDTLRDLGLDPAAAHRDAENGLIRRYNVGGEILTAAQENVPGLRDIMPDALGHEVHLDDPHPPKAPDFTWNPIEMARRTAEFVEAKARRPGELHGLGPVIEAMQTQRPWQ